MNSMDAILKIVTIVSAILGMVAIFLEQLSIKRRLYNEEIRNLQLVKLRYEIEKLVKEAGLDSSAYDSIVTKSALQKRYNLDSFIKVNSTSLLEYFLLFSPSALIVLALVFHEYIKYKDDLMPIWVYFGWFSSHLLVALPLSKILPGAIPNKFFRSIASLLSGTLICLLSGGLMLALLVLFYGSS